MKKSIRKVLCMLMVAVLTMSFVACGTKKTVSNSDGKNDNKNVLDMEELSVEEIFNKMNEATKKAEGATVKGDFGFEANVSDEEISVAGKIKGEMSIEPVKTHMEMDFEVEYQNESMDMEIEMYQIQEDDSVKVYMNVLNQWILEETDMSDVGIDTSMLEDIDIDELLEYLDSAKVKNEDDKYVVTLKITLEKMLEILKENGYEDEIEEYEAFLPEAGLVIKIGIEAETFLLQNISIEFKMDEIELGDDEFIELKECSMNFEYTSYEKQDIDVPKEVIKEAKENENYSFE